MCDERACMQWMLAGFSRVNFHTASQASRYTGSVPSLIVSVCGTNSILTSRATISFDKHLIMFPATSRAMLATVRPSCFKLSKAISGSTGPIFTIFFHKMEGICVVQFFPFLKGRCHGNQFCGTIVAKLPTPALIALAVRNGMGYRYLCIRINSVKDASISYENFVKFGPVTPELTELICERQVRHGQKTGAFSQISPDILARFYQFFTA